MTVFSIPFLNQNTNQTKPTSEIIKYFLNSYGLGLKLYNATSDIFLSADITPEESTYFGKVNFHETEKFRDGSTDFKPRSTYSCENIDSQGLNASILKASDRLIKSITLKDEISNKDWNKDYEKQVLVSSGGSDSTVILKANVFDEAKHMESSKLLYVYHTDNSKGVLFIMSNAYKIDIDEGLYQEAVDEIMNYIDICKQKATVCKEFAGEKKCDDSLS